jgi:hypothetical protein
MNREDLQKAMAAFESNGGAVKQCLPGDHAIRLVPRNLWQCQCGCHGDYTEHSMRAGESGRDSSIIIH